MWSMEWKQHCGRSNRGAEMPWCCLPFVLVTNGSLRGIGWCDLLAWLAWGPLRHLTGRLFGRKGGGSPRMTHRGERHTNQHWGGSKRATHGYQRPSVSGPERIFLVATPLGQRAGGPGVATGCELPARIFTTFKLSTLLILFLSLSLFLSRSSFSPPFILILFFFLFVRGRCCWPACV